MATSNDIKLSSAGRLSRRTTGLLGGRSSGVLSATSRWAEKRTRGRGGGARDDLRKFRKMKIDKVRLPLFFYFKYDYNYYRYHRPTHILYN